MPPIDPPSDCDRLRSRTNGRCFILLCVFPNAATPRLPTADGSPDKCGQEIAVSVLGRLLAPSNHPGGPQIEGRGTIVASLNAETPQCTIGSAASKREAVTKKSPTDNQKRRLVSPTWKRSPRSKNINKIKSLCFPKSRGTPPASSRSRRDRAGSCWPTSSRLRPALASRSNEPHVGPPGGIKFRAGGVASTLVGQG